MLMPPLIFAAAADVVAAPIANMPLRLPSMPDDIDAYVIAAPLRR